MAAVKLGNRQKIERSGEKSDPGGAAHGMKQKRAMGDAGMQPGGEETQQDWSAKGQVDVLQIIKARNNPGVENAVSQCGNRENEAYQRSGSADVKECARGANRRTNQNERTERAHERGEGNKKRVARADVMMAACEKMA